MKTNIRLKKGFTLVELLVVIGIIATLAALTTPAVTGALKRAALNTSINNARQIRLALEDYAVDFDGVYVDEDNAEVILGTATPITTAQQAFNVLMQAGGALTPADEALFFSKELKTEVADHEEGDGDGTFTAQECGYSYVTGLANTSVGQAPLVTTQLSTGTSFYSNVWGHKAVIARVNNSVKAVRITGTLGDDGTVNESVAGTSGDVFNWATMEAPGVVCP